MKEKLYHINDSDLDLLAEELKIYDLKERTKLFSYGCHQLCEMLPNKYDCNHVRGQLFRSSTSVAANYRATQLSQSTATFIAKISIVVEESDETEYWLKLIIDRKLIDNELVNKLHLESKELAAIFRKSRMTAQTNLRNKR